MQRRCEHSVAGKQIDKKYTESCNEIATSYQYSEPKAHTKRKKKRVFALCEKCFDIFFLKRQDWYRAEISESWYNSYTDYLYSHRHYGIHLSGIEVRNFYLSKSEERIRNTWIRNHNNVCSVETVPYEERYKYYVTFISSGMGDVCMLTCQCGEEKDITDYSEW